MMAQSFQRAGGKAAIVFGEYALSHPQAATLRALAQFIQQISSVKMATLTDGANSAGAWLAGAVPHREPGGVAATTVGANAYELLTTEPKQVYCLSGWNRKWIASLLPQRWLLCDRLDWSFVSPVM